MRSQRVDLSPFTQPSLAKRAARNRKHDKVAKASKRRNRSAR